MHTCTCVHVYTEWPGCLRLDGKTRLFSFFQKLRVGFQPTLAAWFLRPELTNPLHRDRIEFGPMKFFVILFRKQPWPGPQKKSTWKNSGGSEKHGQPRKKIRNRKRREKYLRSWEDCTAANCQIAWERFLKEDSKSQYITESRFHKHSYRVIPGHRNQVFDPASVFLSTHSWSQHPACQRCFVGAASGGSLAPEPPRATGVGPEVLRFWLFWAFIFEFGVFPHNFFHFFLRSDFIQCPISDRRETWPSNRDIRDRDALETQASFYTPHRNSNFAVRYFMNSKKNHRENHQVFP